MTQPTTPAPDPDAVTTVAGTDTAAPTMEELAEQLAEQKVRAQLSEFEASLQQTLAAAQSQFSAQNAQIQALMRELATVRAQAGPPDAVVLAQSLATRAKSIAIANPDLGGAHFAGVIDQAARLNDAVQAAAGGKGPVGEAERLATAVHTFFTRTHPRTSGKVLEGLHAAVDEAERILEALPDLAPAASAAAAVASAL